MFNKIGYKANKWLWTRGNKKPPKKYEAYLTSVGLWFVAGMIFTGVCLAFITIDRKDIGVGIFAGCLFLFLLVYVIFMAVWDDKRKGRYDAIYKATLEHWHKTNREYGIEKKEGEQK
jgi:hypothetical protein